eukprot:CAMPEP_0194565414 /NCGR_PEP_ID=MMETSP0292-20121207/4691_1 /TAXON_ID=39354 /ORGANISM="Heterosigma akashiwo, Strain CCMP2393" /LENGTH=461 /DNA_ID=CAMNT_0039414763 /DNA_START=1 /DNA_END=1386 /DNA_ORIENTATION=-
MNCRLRILLMPVLSILCVTFCLLIISIEHLTHAPLASAMLRGSSAAHNKPQHGRYSLAKLVGRDLDQIKPDCSEYFFNKVARVLLSFSGFVYDSSQSSWRLDPAFNSPSLPLRVKAITPTWKGGNLDYESLLMDKTAPPLRSTAEMLQWLDVNAGLREVTIPSGDPAGCALVDAYATMFSWTLDAKEFALPSDLFPDTLYAFSFGADHGCTGLDCPRPGETNELLAQAILEHLVSREKLGAPPPAAVLTQWEIGVALRHRAAEAGASGALPPSLDLQLHGEPGVFHSTRQLWEFFFTEAAAAAARRQGGLRGAAAAAEAPGAPPGSGVVVAHPDHAPRAVWTGLDVHRRLFPRAARPPVLQPALFPLLPGWPAAAARSPPPPPAAAAAAPPVPAFFGGNAAAALHTLQTSGASRGWFDGRAGYSPSNPQPFVRSREAFALYELWARAKLVQDGGNGVTVCL